MIQPNGPGTQRAYGALFDSNGKVQGTTGPFVASIGGGAHLLVSPWPDDIDLAQAVVGILTPDDDPPVNWIPGSVTIYRIDDAGPAGSLGIIAVNMIGLNLPMFAPINIQKEEVIHGLTAEEDDFAKVMSGLRPNIFGIWQDADAAPARPDPDVTPSPAERQANPIDVAGEQHVTRAEVAITLCEIVGLD